MVIKLPRSRESTPVAVTPPSTSLEPAADSVVATREVVRVCWWVCPFQTKGPFRLELWQSVGRFVCVISVSVCARVSRVCPGSPRCLFYRSSGPGYMYCQVPAVPTGPG